MKPARVGFLPLRLRPSTSTLAVMKPSRPENEYSGFAPTSARALWYSPTIGMRFRVGSGTTCAMITPAASLFSSFTIALPTNETLRNCDLAPEFVRQMRKSGAKSQFLSVSFVGSAIVKELKSEAAGVIMAQVVPLPTKKSIPVVAEYQNTLAAVGAKPDYSFSGLEGFISAKVLVEGLKRSGKAPTRAGFIKAMEGIRELDLGEYFVSYSPTNHNGSMYVDITVINGAGLFFN